MDDLISRQQPIDRIRMWLQYDGYSEGERNVMGCTIQMLEGLPSAEPEIIRCKDCKYFDKYTTVPEMYQWDAFCLEWARNTYEDWFCSRVKRRTDETD